MQFSNTSQELVESTEDELACSDVFILGKNVDGVTCVGGIVQDLILKNNGRRTIDKIQVLCRTGTDISQSDLQLSLFKLGAEQNIGSGVNLNSCNSVTIIPFLPGNLGCTDKKIKVDCVI